MTEPGEEAKEPMSEIPTPAEGRSRRRGLTLPPRGQTLSRLQDLEADEAAPIPAEAPDGLSSPKASDALRTASSNAVNDESSTAVLNGGITPASIASAATAPAPPEAAPAVTVPATSTPAYRPAPRAAREPTTRITVDMPDSLHRQISMLSAETRRSIKDLVIEAVEAIYFGGRRAGDETPSPPSGQTKPAA